MIVVILCQPLWGYLADRVLGRSQTYRLCIAWTGTILLLFPFSYHVGGFPLLFINAILLTIGYVSMQGLSSAVMFSFLGPVHRKKFGRLRWIGSFSFMAATLIVGPSMVKLSSMLQLHGRVMVFIAAAVFFFVAMALSRWNEADFQPHTPPKNFSLAFLKNRNIQYVYFTIFCGGAASSAVMLYLGPYIGHLGYSESFFSSLWVAGISCEAFLGYHLDKIVKYTGLKNLLVIACFAEGLRWFLLLHTHSPLSMQIIFMLHGPAIIGYFFASAMYLDTECDESIRSSAQTFLTFSFFFGQVFAFFVASMIVGSTAEITRVDAIRSSFYFYSMMGIIGGFFGWFFIKKESG
jgi:MFS family permease